MTAADGSNLFESTSKIAGQQAARKSGSWRIRIVTSLRERPAALWEIAAKYGVPDHTISGRFTELAKDLVIERTGERRNHPVSGCAADVWRISGTGPAAIPGRLPIADVAELLGYPATLRIAEDLYDRQPLLVGADGAIKETYPGIPYVRRIDRDGGLPVVVRVELVECPGCGKPLKLVIEPPAVSNSGGGPAGGGPASRRPQVKKYRCGNPSCNTTCEGAIVQEPGQPLMLALVMRTF